MLEILADRVKAKHLAGDQPTDFADPIDDSTTFTRPWTIELPLTRADEKKNQIYENACHEGNYALTNILAGARTNEQGGATTK